MRIELRINSGARAGQKEIVEMPLIRIGRHPSNDVRFHPDLDTDVSTFHAELKQSGGRVILVDLNSTNGTFVNGERVRGERAVYDSDVISFGKQGPKAEFYAGLARPPAETRVAPNSPPATTVGGAAPQPAGAAGAAAASGGRVDTNVRVAIAVQQQTGKLRNMVLALGVLVVVGGGTMMFLNSPETRRSPPHIDALLKRNDSLSSLFDKTVASMKGKVKGLDSALALARNEGEQVRARIRSALAAGSGDVAAMTAQLNAAEGRQQAPVQAARTDFEAITAKNSAAIVFLAVQGADGTNSSGSGFNIKPSGLIVTNRHVVQDEEGREATKVMVIFDNTVGKWLPAHVVKISETDELAWLKIDVPGTYPTVLGVEKSPSLHVGAAAAIIGYPLGTGTAGMGGEINKLRPMYTLGPATVSKILSDTLQFDAYAAEGSSGSAIFDARGFVIGVLFGGQSESNGRIVYAVPSRKLVEQAPVP